MKIPNIYIDQFSKKTLTLVVDYGLDPVTKKRKRTKRALDTLDPEVAEGARLQTVADFAAGNYKPSSLATIEEYFDYWFTTPEAKDLDPNTLSHYKNGLYKTRIKPWIGKKVLAKFERDELYAFYEKIIEVGHLDNLEPPKEGEEKKFKTISLTTIKHYHRLIRRVFNHALIEDGIIKNNVAVRMKLPDPDAITDYDPDEELVKVIPQDEIAKLEAEAVNSPHRNLLAVALRTGMRREELLGLTWDCIDEKEKTIFIKRALTYNKTTGYRTKPTKNMQKRKIKITQEVLDALHRQSKMLAAYKLRFGDNYRKDLNLVFCAENGHYFFPGMPTRWFPQFCEKIGITRYTFHSLRHTHASHLLLANEGISYVSRRLGHSDISVTYKYYFNFIPEEERESLKALEERLKKKK